ncbi:MAG TPA: hypothetical protein VEN47_07425 [Myxococcota bacterium]|nr:hypothetical protein [Myxococcota bacterium]
MTTHTISRSSWRSERGRRAGRALALAALAVLAWAALAPIRVESREQAFEIPPGTWARRMAGEKREILPARIRLTLGVRDVLLLHNRDEVPQVFGPTVLMPGQSFRLPFGQAGSYSFACTAHLSGQLLVIVDPAPTTPWARLGWRVRSLLGW